MTEQSARMREDLLKQFSSADAHNPLADFKAGTMAAMRARRRAAGHQPEGAATSRSAALKAEVVKLQAERDEGSSRWPPSTRARPPRAAPTRRRCSTRVDAIARARGDDCDAVGDVPGAGGRKGDVLVGIDGCSGPPRARIVFEAKNAYVPQEQGARRARRGDGAARRRLRRLGRARPTTCCPAAAAQLREVNGDKLFVVFDPEDGSRLALEVAYALARARTLMADAGGDGLDAGALRTEVERALAAMDDVRRIKSQLTQRDERDRRTRAGSSTRWPTASAAHLAAVDELVVAGTGDDSPPQGTLGLAARPAPAGAWRARRRAA